MPDPLAVWAVLQDGEGMFLAVWLVFSLVVAAVAGDW
jgi:hypothetical protein